MLRRHLLNSHRRAGGFTPADISGLTLWLPDGSFATTASGTDARVTQWSDQSGNARHFTQSTSSNRPLLSGTTLKENRIQYSCAVGSWTKTRSSVSSDVEAPPAEVAAAVAGNIADRLIEDDTASNSHYAFPGGFSTAPGVVYRATIFAKQAVGTRNLWVAIEAGAFASVMALLKVDLGTGDVLDSSATIVSSSVSDAGGDWWKISFTASGAAAIGASTFDVGLLSGSDVSYNGDSTSAVDLCGAQICIAAAANEFCYTTTRQIYRGINGRSVVVFDGLNDYLTSTATLADLITASASTLFAVIKPDIVSGTYTILASTPGGYHYLQIASSNYDFTNYDGSTDTILKAASAGSVAILVAKHSGGYLDLSVNGSAATHVASGNTSLLTSTWTMGGKGGTYFNGSICEMAAFNRVLSPYEEQRVYEYLAERWLA